MSWYQIIGHDKIKKILQNSIINNRISNAYCFIGIEGIGKDALAIQFAKVCNCEKPIIDDGFIDSCDKCHNCISIDNLAHPNLELIFSLPTGKSSDTKGDSAYDKLSSEQIEIIKDEIENKAKNHYLPLKIPNATQIKISSIRDVKQKLSLSSFNDKRRFVIVLKADEMNIEAENAFLKTLEEPQENITIILISSKPDSLLQTIISRCQQINFSPLDENKIVRKLILDNNSNEIDAKIAARFAQGSYLKALDFLDEENRVLRNEIVNLLRISLKKVKYREELVKNLKNFLKDKDKNQINKIMQMLIFWLNDVNIIKITGNSELIINSDDIQTIQKFFKGFGNKDIPKAINEIENYITMIYRNVNINLILISLFIKLRRIFID